jgi:1,2-beta-oligoglucan phosphorylase
MKTIRNQIDTHTLQSGGIRFELLSTGDVYRIMDENDQLNLLRGNTLDGQVGNIYLRVRQGDRFLHAKLLGVHSASTFSSKDHRAYYQGAFLSIRYQVILTVHKTHWTYEVFMRSSEPVKVDLLYGQDVGISDENAILNNENYVSQYIDHKAFPTENGYAVRSRQNQGRARVLEVGSTFATTSYSTDGFQFFGTEYKATAIPQALAMEKLESRVYQYEFSYVALMTDEIEVTDDVSYGAFYGSYSRQRDDQDTILVMPDLVKSAPRRWTLPREGDETRLLSISNPITGLDQSLEPNRLNEIRDGYVLSNFTDSDHHVVSQKKERLVERPHGHVMIGGDILGAHVMATTNYMFGVFSSHITYGNTSFHKLLGDVRSPLDLNKLAGLRMYLKDGNTYRIFGLPTRYEVGATTTKWVYVLENDTIVVSSYVDISTGTIKIELDSTKKRPLDLIVTMQILMAGREYVHDIRYERTPTGITVYPTEGSMIDQHVPSLKYRIDYDASGQLLTENDLLGLTANQGLIGLKYDQQAHVDIEIRATTTDTYPSDKTMTYEEADQKGIAFFNGFTHDLRVSSRENQADLDRLNAIRFWYTHNALIHYASPHGLEQYNGAAWGTRDVLQGPFELFLANGHEDLARDVIIKVYERQFLETGDFPQWFMAEPYETIQAHDSHGDIIVWPIKALGMYLRQTGDLDILKEEVRYMSKDKGTFGCPEPIIDHVKRQVDRIEKDMIKGTDLPAYGGGDWNDTLQPANHELTKSMSSSWTTALLYESLVLFGREIEGYDQDFSKSLLVRAENIKKDYHAHMVAEGLPAGFVIFSKHNRLLLHPRDDTTGLKYRLLSYNRAILSGIARPEQIATFKDTIDRYLWHPDGARLMDQAVAYQGGKTTYFTRAETAANFGREIGLQYVHAHIRYIEAMAMVGESERAMEGLYAICPILIEKNVKNAHLRQSNLYFSSSDAWFYDRYEAKARFFDIKKQNVSVKGGWRLYSSGPGIYVNQLISTFLGIRKEKERLVIAPSLPKAYDGLLVDFSINKKRVKIIYDFSFKGIRVDGESVPFEPVFYPYRKPGLSIELDALKKDMQTIEVGLMET